MLTAVTAAASAAGTTTVNPYWAGAGGSPGGAWAGVWETGETAAEVIVAGAPSLR